MPAESSSCHSGSILEFASPVFFSRLTVEKSLQLENCQRKAFAIILDTGYRSYESSLLILLQERLSDRRCSAAIKFGEKYVTNPKHADMVPRRQRSRYNLRNMKPFQEYCCHTDRMYQSSLPAITRLLNQ